METNKTATERNEATNGIYGHRAARRTTMTTRTVNTANDRIALALAERTVDAYSRLRYADGEWTKAARLLIRDGWSERQIEAILRSKWMRWAADQANRQEGEAKAMDLTTYMRDPRSRCSKDAVNKMVRETPETMNGSDLAGACEGEQIADALDLLMAIADGQIDQQIARNRATKILNELKARVR